VGVGRIKVEEGGGGIAEEAELDIGWDLDVTEVGRGVGKRVKE
jgi:hypothetical protein